jgi:hypothetical protein
MVVEYAQRIITNFAGDTEGRQLFVDETVTLAMYALFCWTRQSINTAL